VIVNPNQPGCAFESKSVAGVGVMFYVLLALRAELRHRGTFDAATQPKLDALLPLVALGTVADVVKLDANNRRLVAQGLKRVRAGAPATPVWPPCSVPRGARHAWPPPSTSALPWGRASTRRGGCRT
jgi:single-stranded DNA-specific DHH superfamily exonuclease